MKYMGTFHGLHKALNTSCSEVYKICTDCNGTLAIHLYQIQDFIIGVSKFLGGGGVGGAGYDLIKLSYLPKLFGQTGLSKQCRPRSDATELHGDDFYNKYNLRML